MTKTLREFYMSVSYIIQIAAAKSLTETDPKLESCSNPEAIPILNMILGNYFNYFRLSRFF